MSTLTILLTILQLASSLLTSVQNNPSVTPEQKVIAIDYANNAIKMALDAVTQLPPIENPITLSAAIPVPPQEQPAQPITSPTVTQPAAPQPMPAPYSIQIVDNQLKANGGRVSFSIVDQDGKIARMDIAGGARANVLFSKAGFKGVDYTWRNTTPVYRGGIYLDGHEYGPDSIYGVYQLNFQGVDAWPTVEIDTEQNITLQLEVQGEKIEAKVKLNS